MHFYKILVRRPRYLRYDQAILVIEYSVKVKYYKSFLRFLFDFRWVWVLTHLMVTKDTQWVTHIRVNTQATHRLKW